MYNVVFRVYMYVCVYNLCYAVSLVGLEGGGNSRLSRFAHYLRSILPHADVTLTEMTAKAIGQLALAEGTYTAEYVEFEMKRALEWISGNEHKKLAAVSLEEKDRWRERERERGDGGGGG